MPLLKRRTALLVVLVLLATSVPVPAQSPRAQDPELAAGIALVREGDFEAAVLKLDTVVRRLLADVTRQKDAAQAYLYLGVAFLELNQELVARGKFQQALGLDPQLRLDAREFSPEQIRVFESARVEARTRPSPAAASPSPKPRSSPSAPATAVAANEAEKKKKKRSPLLWILGGAAVIGGGAAAAAGGGGGGGAQPTTTNPGVGNTTSTAPSTTPPETTTTTTQPGENPPPTTTTTTTTTVPGTPSTTTPTTTPGTTTTTTSSTTTTTTTTTTTLPACTYSISGASTPPAFALLGGPGHCDVTTSNASCAWSVGTSDAWITIQNGSGSGSGPVNFTVGGSLAARTGRITLFQGSQPFCTIQQTALLSESTSPAGITFTSELDVPGAQGQVVVDGANVTFQSRGSHQGWIEAGRGVHRIEATVVSAEGTPGTWRFRLAGPVAAGSLRVIAGVAASAGGEEIVFRLSGKPGERVLFTFRSR